MKLKNAESGATPTQIAVGTAVAAFLFVAWVHMTGGRAFEDDHEELAYRAFEAMQENDIEIFGDMMIEVWDEEVVDYSYQSYYVGIMEHAGGHDGLAAKFKDRMKPKFVAARAASAKDFNWNDAEFDKAIVNNKSVTSELKLKGFIVEAGDKRYLFKFYKPEPGLYFFSYSGPTKAP